MRTSSIVNALTAAGYQVGKVTEPDQFMNVDGEVEIAGTAYHVQVGEGYVSLNESGGEGEDFYVAFGECRRSIKGLMQDVTKAVKVTA